MSDFAKKLTVFLIFAVIAGGISFTYARVLRDEADKFGGGAKGEAVLQCMERNRERLPGEQALESACSCAVAEFERRKFDITDIANGANPEGDEVVEACFAMAS